MVAEFAVEVFQNEYLTEGAREVDAIVTVAASGMPAAGVAPVDIAQVVIVDCSGSMRYPPTKLDAAKKATATAIDTLRDGVSFAVVEGTGSARMVYPTHRGLAVASPRTKTEAKRAVRVLVSDGGTAMGRWLALADQVLAGHEGPLKHAILLTDGQNPVSYTHL